MLRRSVALLVCFGGLGAWAAGFPSLCVEIGPDHPLFVFEAPGMDEATASGQAQVVIEAWIGLPEELKAYATLQIGTPGIDPVARQERFRALLQALQDADVPVVVEIADENPRRIYPLDLAEALIREFTCIKGIQARGLAFNEYYPFGAGEDVGTPPNVRWLVGAVDLAARYGRFIAIPLGELGWPRVMVNAWCRPLHEKIRQCSAYTVPLNEHRGAHNLARTAALMGLWLEGGVDQWGISAQSYWYDDARFIEPGLFGSPTAPGAMPPALYRAMILNGAMTGATVYSFGPGDDLWFGKAARYWRGAIHQTLVEVLEQGLIARKRLVARKARVAYQLAVAQTAQDFHFNLRDIDGVLDKGLLIHGAYGMERPGQIPELIPNTGKYYWVPFLSPYAPEEVLSSFAVVVRPGSMASSEEWTRLLDRHYTSDGDGTAFISRVGRGVFVMHTRENVYAEQTFRVPRIPAPVRDFEVSSGEDGVLITWPFREGDISHNVYRRILPDTRFALIAGGVEDRRYLDAESDPNETVAYAVTALTNELETYQGTVNYGDYRVLSTVESRIAEEVVVTPLLGFGKSRLIAEPVDLRPKAQQWWPNYDGVTEDRLGQAQAIAERIEAWDRAFALEDLEGVLELYSTSYEDPQGWRFQYVRRAYQWFFERYNACRMHRQVRRWDFRAADTSGQVNVLLYCRFTGVALTDPFSRFADTTAYFPRTRQSEVWVTFTDKEGPWRIMCTNPALPNFKDILSFSAGPHDSLAIGADLAGKQARP